MRKRILTGLLLILSAFIICGPFGVRQSVSSEVVPLEDKRELFADDYLIDSMENAEIRVHQPQRREIINVCDQSFEGNGCGFMSILYDPDEKIYRMYYKAWSLGTTGKKRFSLIRIAMLTSKDGIKWERPILNLFELNGSKKNNIVLGEIGKKGNCHDFNPFLDLNPAAKPEAKYKAIGAGGIWPKGFGVHLFQSPDGIHWKQIGSIDRKNELTLGAFDSQNTSFWSPEEKKYVFYYRSFDKNKARTFRKAVSDDFMHWKDVGLATFPEGEGPVLRSQYYVNLIQRYYRAPHILIGFPARYVDNGKTASTVELPEWPMRELRINKVERWGTSISDSVYVTTRDGINFRRSNDVFFSPEGGNWSYGDNFLSWPIIETKTEDPDKPVELSFYTTESYFRGDETIFRRCTLRLDGFGSIHSGIKEGVVTTKPIRFSGNELSLNYKTSAAGLLRVEICDQNGEPLHGYSKDDCDILYGDSLDRRVSWKGKTSVGSLSFRTVILKFYLQEADVFSLKFEKEKKAPKGVLKLDSKPTATKPAPVKKASEVVVFTSKDQSESASGSPIGNRKLVWSDDFDYPDKQLDDEWISENGPSTHILCSRWRENAVVKDGTLRFNNKKEKRAGQDWTSASLHSKKQFLYGYYECRYRYAAATGTNNSFWLMTIGKVDTSKEPNAARFELDINEGHYPNEINTNIHNYDKTRIWRGQKVHLMKLKHHIPDEKLDLAKEYHVYGFLWTKNSLVWYFDGKEIRREKNTFCYTPTPVRLSQAIFIHGGEITDAIDGTFMEVDYVRVYQ